MPWKSGDAGASSGTREGHAEQALGAATSAS
jgi:hypothetical protein